MTQLENYEPVDECIPQSTSPLTMPPDHSHLVDISRFEELPISGSYRCANCSRVASVFCRADSAILCSPCDIIIHSANRLAARHYRVPLPVRRSLNSLSAQSSDELLLQAGAHVAREAAHLALSSGTVLRIDPCTTDASTADAEGTERKRRTRQEALVRFRLKRNRRSFAKIVRYECRKTLAENRPRVKGRFVNKCDIAMIDKYGQRFQRFLHEVALPDPSVQSSDGSSILSDAANSLESQIERKYGLY